MEVVMLTSILDSMKTALDVPVSDDTYDEELLMGINTIFFTLNQLGVGPETSFTIDDNSIEWTDFISDIETIAMVKTYMQLRLKLLFDPPSNSSLATAMKEQAAEYEWRMNVAKDTYRVEEVANNGG